MEQLPSRARLTLRVTREFLDATQDFRNYQVCRWIWNSTGASEIMSGKTYIKSNSIIFVALSQKLICIFTFLQMESCSAGHGSHNGRLVTRELHVVFSADYGC